MIITCPACDAQYLLPDDAIASKGRRVKCTSCKYTWHQMPETPEFEEEEASFEAVDNYKEDYPPVFTDSRKVETETASNSGFSLRSLVTGLGVALILLALTMAFLVIERGFVVKKWPPAALLFETIGLPVPAVGAGLSFESVQTDISSTEAAPGILKVTGNIVNSTKSDMVLPNFKVQLNGEAGMLKEWPINLRSRVIPAGKSVSFEYLLKDAPADGRNVALFFIE